MRCETRRASKRGEEKRCGERHRSKSGGEGSALGGAWAAICGPEPRAHNPSQFSWVCMSHLISFHLLAAARFLRLKSVRQAEDEDNSLLQPPQHLLTYTPSLSIATVDATEYDTIRLVFALHIDRISTEGISNKDESRRSSNEEWNGRPYRGGLRRGQVCQQGRVRHFRYGRISHCSR